MKQKPTFLEPVLVRQQVDALGRKHWLAWNEVGALVAVGMGDFDIFDAMLRQRGYTMISPNCSLAMDIRNRLREMHNL